MRSRTRHVLLTAVSVVPVKTQPYSRMNSRRRTRMAAAKPSIIWSKITSASDRNWRSCGHWRFDCPVSCGTRKPDRQIAANAPMRWRTQRALLKPRSTAPSSVQFTPRAAPFRSGVQKRPFSALLGCRSVHSQSVVALCTTRCISLLSQRRSRVDSGANRKFHCRSPGGASRYSSPCSLCGPS